MVGNLRVKKKKTTVRHTLLLCVLSCRSQQVQIRENTLDALRLKHLK